MITTTTFPLELVPYIFQAVADSETDPHAWWSATDAHHGFFTAASQVSKAWRKLALPYLGLFYIKSKPHGTSMEEWDRKMLGLANIRSRFKGPAQLLHIEKMDLVDQRLQLSKNMVTVVLAVKDRLEALSLESGFVYSNLLRPRDEKLSGIFYCLLSRVRRFHVWSVIDTSVADATGSALSVYHIGWQKIAAFVWSSTRSNIVQELALSSLRIAQDWQQQAMVPCPVENLVLSDVYFEARRSCSTLFPKVEHLVLRQTKAWPVDVPAFNLIWDISSSLRSLHITWSKAPFPLLSDNTEILKSPKLEVLHIRAEPDSIIDYTLNEADFLERLTEIFGEVTNLKYLTIEGIDLLGSNEEIGQLCAAFRLLCYLPALVEIPRFTLHPHPDYFPTNFDISDRYYIHSGLNGLRQRGLEMAYDYLDQTVWRYTLKGCERSALPHVHAGGDTN